MAEACKPGTHRKVIKRKQLCLREVASAGTRAKRKATGRLLNKQYKCQRGARGRYTKCRFVGPGGRHTQR